MRNDWIPKIGNIMTLEWSLARLADADTVGKFVLTENRAGKDTRGNPEHKLWRLWR